MSFSTRSDEPEVMGEINMTPLVDVMLVLLVVFIVTIPVIQHAVKVQLPRASSERTPAPPQTLQLSVDAQGRTFLGTVEVAPSELESALRVEALKEPQPRLHIRGDRAVAYEHVAAAMAAAHRAGLRTVGFVTQAAQP